MQGIESITVTALPQQIKNKMSIDISKVIQTYENCLTVLKAKQNLCVDNRELNALFQRPDFNTKQHRNICVQFIEDGIMKIIRTWSKKFSIYESLQDAHKHSVAHLQLKIDSLRNNTDIVTREDQLFAQIQAMMAQWRQSMIPAEYYNNKFRREFRSQLEQKLQNLKLSMSKSHNTSAPLYTRKIQNQFKENIMGMYYDEIKIDSELVNMTIGIHDELAHVIGQLDQYIEQVNTGREISLEGNQFFRDSHEILNRTTRPSDRRIRAYGDSLNEAIKRNYTYWATLRKSLQYLIHLINEIQKGLASVKSNFEQKEQKIYKLLLDVPNSISKIFQVDIIYNLIKSFNSSYGASTIIASLKEKMMKRKQFASKNQNQCVHYANKVVEMARQRYDNFHHYALMDKKLFQDQAKSEKIVTKLMLQSFRDLLEECYKITKETRRIFLEQCKIRELGQHELSPYLSRLIIKDIDNLSMDSTNASRIMAEQPADKKKESVSKKVLAQQKIAKVEQFINSIEIFQSDNVSEDEKHYSCALGPKLLLHGKLYVLPDGLFFQSHFNKKNLLFGKTKLFIPKSDIVQIDMKNTLLVFPDAVLIKTEHGLVSFHALGQRKMISAAIKEAYLGEIVEGGDEGGAPSEKPNFKLMDESKKAGEDKIAKHTKALEVPIYETTLKGSNLGLVFRRYFSDDKFELKGKQYETFKAYHLALIDAKNPKQTPLNPSHPSYFAYKTEQSPENHYPQSSTRVHEYMKDLPKIPFLSKGGQGKCEEKETYQWLGPEVFVIDVVSTVKGFSLTEGMEIFIKYVVRQVADGVKVTITAEVKFAKESSSNSLVKNPTFSNIKESMVKVFSTIQACQRAKKGNGTTASSPEADQQEMKMETESTPSGGSGQVQLSKQQLMYAGIGLVVFYILTIVLLKAF